jgi:phosphatidylinositol glycan class A protein
LVDVIPEILRKYSNVHFIIGGDGPKMNILKEMCDKYNIADKVELLGSLPHSEVRNVLCRGHIFLNTSLTEAFCIAILEAASCGLLCVSTNVGGIPEVLPPEMIYLAPARPKPLIEQLEVAIKNVKNIPCTQMHETVKSLYSWHNVAERTERVYYKVMERPQSSLLTRLKTSCSLGLISGIGQVIFQLIGIFWLWLFEIVFPVDSIDIAEDFNSALYIANPEKFGNHLYDVR